MPTLASDDLAFVVWPFATGDRRYDDPVAVVRDFATELVGFDAPILGPFRQGDSRSGEVEIRAVANGPATTVLVRRFGPDDSWWVIGSLTADIEVDDPAPQSAIDDPLQLRGRARAFEDNVQVSVIADGDSRPIGEGFVTGSGDEKKQPEKEKTA